MLHSQRAHPRWRDILVVPLIALLAPAALASSPPPPPPSPPAAFLQRRARLPFGLHASLNNGQAIAIGVGVLVFLIILVLLLVLLCCRRKQPPPQQQQQHSPRGQSPHRHAVQRSNAAAAVSPYVSVPQGSVIMVVPEGAGPRNRVWPGDPGYAPWYPHGDYQQPYAWAPKQAWQQPAAQVRAGQQAGPYPAWQG